MMITGNVHSQISCPTLTWWKNGRFSLSLKERVWGKTPLSDSFNISALLLSQPPCFLTWILLFTTSHWVQISNFSDFQTVSDCTPLPVWKFPFTSRTTWVSASILTSRSWLVSYIVVFQKEKREQIKRGVIVQTSTQSLLLNMWFNPWN